MNTSLKVLFAFTLFSPSLPLSAQEKTVSPTETTSDVPVIAEEPRAIDPATFLPAALANQVTVDFSSSSLREVLDWLREKQKLVVLVENDALADIGVLPGDPVSDKLLKTPLYLMLNRLRSLGLSWRFEDNIVHVAPEEVYQEQLTTIPYNIGTLLDQAFDVDELAATIEDGVSPESWESVGGSGVVSFLGDVMFIRQTDDLHREVRGLLAALLKHGRRTFALDPPQHRVLREKLATEVSVAFRDMPLMTAARELAEIAQIDIRLDLLALQEVRIRERAPITLALSNRTLETVLQAMLINLDLTWILRDGVLWITSQQAAEEFFKTAVYDVRDLCRDTNESDALYDAIVSQTSNVWAELGGTATIQFPRPGILVVRSTERVQDELLQLLESYRTALRASKPRPEKELDPTEIITVYYRMHANVAEGLEQLIPRLIAPDSWKSGTQPDSIGEILSASSLPELSSTNRTLVSTSESSQIAQTLVTARRVLIIRQTRNVHTQITDVISRIKLGDHSVSGGGMGGGGGFGGSFRSATIPQTKNQSR